MSVNEARFYDTLVRELRTAERELSLLLDDMRVVLPEEREALTRAIALATTYALEHEPVRYGKT